jgi:hypothetical protein
MSEKVSRWGAQDAFGAYEDVTSFRVELPTQLYNELVSMGPDFGVAEASDRFELEPQFAAGVLVGEQIYEEVLAQFLPRLGETYVPAGSHRGWEVIKVENNEVVLYGFHPEGSQTKIVSKDVLFTEWVKL